MIKGIVCINILGGMSFEGKLLGHIPEDLALFKTKTKNHPIIMGYNTALSLPNGMPLPDRRNIVLLKADTPFKVISEFVKKGFEAVNEDDIEEEFQDYMTDPIQHAWIIGGAKVFNDYMHLIDEMHITVAPCLPLKSDCNFPLEEFDSWDFKWAQGDNIDEKGSSVHIYRRCYI